MWPFAQAYPERTARDVDGKTFDYIIVGGGTAGCALAARLSEDPSVSVLVLEKGRVQDNWVSRVPLISQNILLPNLQVVKRLSEPVTSVGGRRVRFWTCEALGGATRINGTLMTRGVPGGYNEWASEFGLDDWGWDTVEPYFRKSENAFERPDAKYRGHDGPIKVRHIPSPFRSTAYVGKALTKLGLPVVDDGNDPDAPSQGCYKTDVTVDANGQRVSAYRAWLNADVANARKAHLTICTGVIVPNLEIDGNAGEVKGVYVRPRGAARGSRDALVKARREVIVCGGALCSPQLLMLSGLGPAAELKKHGIPVARDMPQVGSNLADHTAFPMMMELPRNDTIHLLEGVWGLLWSLIVYLFSGRGLLSNGIVPITAFIRTTALDEKTMTVQRRIPETGEDTMDPYEPRNVPDVEVMLNPVNSFNAMPGHNFYSIFTTLVQPYSRGSLSLASNNPEADVKVDYRALTDPRDITAVRRSARFAMHVIETFLSTYPDKAELVFAPGMDWDYFNELYRDEEVNSDIQPMSHPPATAPVSVPIPGEGHSSAGKKSRAKGDKLVAKEKKYLETVNWRDVTDEQIDEYARAVVMTALHLTGTCRMSLRPEDGVVDQKLRVHGMRNLRVADASVLPKVPSSHTMAPTIMVAERCADFIKDAWADAKSK